MVCNVANKGNWQSIGIWRPGNENSDGVNHCVVRVQFRLYLRLTTQSSLTADKMAVSAEVISASRKWLIFLELEVGIVLSTTKETKQVVCVGPSTHLKVKNAY